MAHENLKPYLWTDPGKQFVADLTRQVYPWAHRIPTPCYIYRVLDEVTIRYSTGELTRKGLDKSAHYRMDCVFLIQPGRAALNQGSCYTVGIELKNSVEDLRADDKIQHYQGWTDYFFLGVPDALVPDAVDKIDEIVAAHPDCQNKIGLFAVDSGEISIYPRRQLVTDAHRIALQEQIIYNYIFAENKAVRFEVKDIQIERVELRDEYKVCVPSISTAHSEEHKDGETTSEEVLSPTDGESPIPEVTPEQPELTAEELAEAKEKAKQQRAEAAARNAERLARLADRAVNLPSSVAKTYNSLKPTDKEVFWSVVDGKAHRGDIADATNLSVPAVAKSLETLIKSDMVLREGGKKHGRYIVGVSTDKSNACETCKKRTQCGYQGAADGNCAHHS